MAYVDVPSWSVEHVINWIRGLHISLADKDLTQFLKNQVNGNRLLLQTAQDLVELIPTIRVEPLQAILHGMNLLRRLNYNFETETLYSLTLNLACQARYLFNRLVEVEKGLKYSASSTSVDSLSTGTTKSGSSITKVNSNTQIYLPTKERVSLETLDDVSILVDHILYVVDWLNTIILTDKRSQFCQDFKSIVLRIAVELTSTAQRDQFVEQPNDIIKKTSKSLAEYCEWVVLAVDDPDFIKPCWLEVVSIKKKVDENDFGIVIKTNSPNSLNIEKVVFSSPAHRSGQIAVGDEIIQIDYQTVIGWPHERVEHLINTFTKEVILTLKKKPSQPSLNPALIVMRPYLIPSKKVLSQNFDSLNYSEVVERDQEAPKVQDPREVTDVISEPPKEPKGPVYELSPLRPRREFKRRVSISGSIPDASVDLPLSDSLPISPLSKSPTGRSTEKNQD